MMPLTFQEKRVSDKHNTVSFSIYPTGVTQYRLRAAHHGITAILSKYSLFMVREESRSIPRFAGYSCRPSCPQGVGVAVISGVHLLSFAVLPPLITMHARMQTHKLRERESVCLSVCLSQGGESFRWNKARGPKSGYRTDGP